MLVNILLGIATLILLGLSFWLYRQNIKLHNDYMLVYNTYLQNYNDLQKAYETIEDDNQIINNQDFKLTLATRDGYKQGYAKGFIEGKAVYEEPYEA